MTPNEAGELLVLMQATWQNLAPDDLSARLWVNDLTQRCEHPVAMDAFLALRDSQDHAPSWATFLAAYENASKAAKHTPPALPAADEPKADPVRLAAHIERARAALTRMP